MPVWELEDIHTSCRNILPISGWLGSRVVSVLDSGAEGPGFKSQPRRCRVTVLGKLFTPIIAFAVERNSLPCTTAVWRRRCSAPGGCRCRSISPAGPALSSKPVAATCGGRMMGQTDRPTDGQTDARLFHKPCSAYYASSANNILHRQFWSKRMLVRFNTKPTLQLAHSDFTLRPR